MTDNRRPLKTRSAAWAGRLAAGLARLGVSPDALSALSIVFAAAGFWAFWLSAHPQAEGPVRAGLLAGAAVLIQLRLLVNMMDGMVAMEHGRGGPYGPIWNELPDRIADVLFLVGAGYALRIYDPLFGPLLGWFAAILAMLTAYIRELGRGLGLEADFAGPGAKPHRMAVLTLACLVAAGLGAARSDWTLAAVWVGLALINVLTLVTVIRRTLRLAARLRSAG